MRKLHVLFFGEAVTLAHVARPVALAGTLDPERYRVTLAADSRYDHLMRPDGLERVPLGTISTGQFLEALARGSPVYRVDTLERYVAEDLRLMDSLRPDLVVGDFRLSLSVSARLRGLPYVGLSNVYWSPFARQSYQVPELPLVRVLGVPMAQALFNAVRPLAFALHARPINRLRRRFGLPSLGPDLRAVYTDADWTLYCDPPGLIETAPLPGSHRFIGPVAWSPQVALPAWWSNRIDPARPVIFLTLGSSGAGAVLGSLLEALAALEVTVMVASVVDGPSISVAPNIFSARFLPGDQAAARADLMICNGGSPTTMQALARGVPVIGVPSNLDQFLNMSAVARFGAGLLLRPGRLRPAVVQAAVLRVLGDARFREGASQLRSQIEACPSSLRFPRFVEGLGVLPPAIDRDR